MKHALFQVLKLHVFHFQKFQEGLEYILIYLRFVAQSADVVVHLLGLKGLFDDFYGTLNVLARFFILYK
jgi:hypothetical protein